MFTPFNQRASFTLKGESYAVAPVTALKFPWNPNAVIRLIIAIGILALNAVLLTGCRSHVFKEVLERVPTFTNGNTAAPIVLEYAAFWVQASLPDSLPHAMFERSRFMVGGIPWIPSKSHAPTTFRIPGQQVAGTCERRFPAIAITEPHSPFIVSALQLHDSEHAKLFSRQIN